MRRAPALASLILAGAALAAADPDPSFTNWPQFRGPGGQGISAEAGLPLTWSASENVVWKTPIPGRGHSSPVVWGNRIFLTTAVEGEISKPGFTGVAHLDEGKEFVHPDGVGADRTQTLKVLAVAADSGQILWEKTAWEGNPYDTRHRRGSFASPTPIVDGERVYAWFGSEGMYTYDLEGKLLWKAELGGIAAMGVGVGTSPVLHGELIILQCDEDGGEKSFIAALDRKTGREAWRVARKVQVSWATPVVVRAAGRDELVTAGAEAIIAYDPATGKELWRAKGLESNAVPSPVAGPDVVVLTSGYPSKVAMAIRPGGNGDVTGTKQLLWKYEKGTAYVPSPILYHDLVYLVTDRGLVTALDARTGAIKYEGGRPPIPATFMASPVVIDGRIVLMSEDGDAFVIKAGPVHEVERTNSLGEPIFASPAVSQGRLFIRGAQNLYCIGRKKGA